MDTFVAFYNLYILLLLIFMPNVFLQLWLDFRIIQMEMKEESSSYHQYHACIFFFFTVQYVFNCIPSHSKAFLFFLSKSLLLRWSLFIRLNKSADFQFLGEIQSYLSLLPFHYFFRGSFFAIW